MTTLIPTSVRDFLRETSYARISVTVGLAVVALLVVLLVQMEIMGLPGQRRERNRRLGVVIAPLVLAFAVLAVGRIVDLVSSG